MQKPMRIPGIVKAISKLEMLFTVIAKARNGTSLIGKRHASFILGYVHRTNNVKELIKVRGFQVAPPELEAVLLNHPDIVDCAVIAIKQAHSDTELPRAYIVRRPGTKITAEEVKRLISEQLAAYKQLTGGVKFLAEIPKSASGKILKKDLRAQAEEEEGESAKEEIRESAKL
jgi:acyl-coenzyme A synthetase/AMP-(fatty) acid ligase